MWYFQEAFSPNIILRNFMGVVFSITLFSNFNDDNFKEILYLLEYLWNNVYFVFFILKR